MVSSPVSVSKILVSEDETKVGLGLDGETDILVSVSITFLTELRD